MLVHLGIDRGRFAQGKLHGLQRCCIEFLWKLHGPRHVGDPPVELSIDKVCHASKKEADGRRDHEVVADVTPGNLVPKRIPKRVQCETEHAAMGRHPAVHHAKENERVVQEVLQVVKEHVAEPSAKQHAKDSSAYDKVRNFVRGNIAIAKLRKSPNDKDAQKKSRQIRQAVPSQTEIFAEADNEGD